MNLKEAMIIKQREFKSEAFIKVNERKKTLIALGRTLGIKTGFNKAMFKQLSLIYDSQRLRDLK